MLIFGQEDIIMEMDLSKVLRHVETYFKGHLPHYAVLAVSRKDLQYKGSPGVTCGMWETEEESGIQFRIGLRGI